MNIKIDLKIFVFIIIYCITKQIEIYILLMSFALIHECTHLLLAILLGLKSDSISISPYGFCINLKTKCEDYNIKIKRSNILSIKKIIIYAAGPMANLLITILALICYKIGLYEIFGNIKIDLVIYSNILLFLFNLLPIYPLDGGRIIKEILHINFGIEKSYVITNIISNITAIALTIAASIFILIYKNIAIPFAIGYIWILIILNNRNIKNIKKIWKIVKMYKKTK